MKVGIMLPVGESGGRMRGWDELRALAETAEAEGLDSVWVADHFFGGVDDGSVHGIHEGWSLVGALAAVTTRIEIGTLVICTSFRNPGLVAKMATTADLVSGGRLVLGLGAGWSDAEYEAFGYPTDHRVGRFAEAIEIVARLLGGERLTFEGRYYTLRDAVLAPAPLRRIPILAAAERPRMLGLAAKWADARVTAWYRGIDDRLRSSAAAFEEALAAAGRDPGEVMHTIGIDAGESGVPEGMLEACAALGFGHAIVHLAPATPESIAQLAASRR